MVDENITPTPKIVLEEYLEEHNHTSDVREAHPIEQDVLHEVCDTKKGPILLEYDLALLQAIAVRELLPYNNDHEVWVGSHPSHRSGFDIEQPRDRPGDVHYYQVSSRSFYELLSIAYQKYDGVRIEVENVADIVEAHTRQYLKDVHGYEGDFGNPSISDSAGEQSEPDFGGQVANDSIDKLHEPTLCNAQNDAHWLRDEMPDDTHYVYTDARGFVVEEGTHDAN